MTIDSALLTRSDAKCELCAAANPDQPLEVAPSDGSVEQSVLLCNTCQLQINGKQALDGNHWRCLNDSMWSQVPAVQVMAYRLLTRLGRQGEGWASDLLDMMYMEEDVRQWAEAANGEEEEDQEPTRDCNGAILQAGDNVTLVKDLDVKGAGFTAKRGTPVRGISLTSNPKHIEGRVNGVRVVLVAEYMKKQ